MADGLWMFSQVSARRSLAADSSDPIEEDTPQSSQKANAKCSDHRQSERQDRRKRGLRGYVGNLVETAKNLFHWTVEIVKRPDTEFVVLPKRWIVERTFSWSFSYRRLSKDYEQLPENSEAMILVAMYQPDE